MVESNSSKNKRKGLKAMGDKFYKALDLLREDSVEDTADIYDRETAKEDNQQQAMQYILEGRI